MRGYLLMDNSRSIETSVSSPGKTLDVAPSGDRLVMGSPRMCNCIALSGGSNREITPKFV